MKFNVVNVNNDVNLSMSVSKPRYYLVSQNNKSELWDGCLYIRSRVVKTHQKCDDRIQHLKPSLKRSLNIDITNLMMTQKKMENKMQDHIFSFFFSFRGFLCFTYCSSISLSTTYWCTFPSSIGNDVDFHCVRLQLKKLFLGFFSSPVVLVV